MANFMKHLILFAAINVILAIHLVDPSVDREVLVSKRQTVGDQCAAQFLTCLSSLPVKATDQFFTIFGQIFNPKLAVNCTQLRQLLSTPCPLNQCMIPTTQIDDFVNCTTNTLCPELQTLADMATTNPFGLFQPLIALFTGLPALLQTAGGCITKFVPSG
jgi:hypothetical protein